MLQKKNQNSFGNPPMKTVKSVKFVIAILECTKKTNLQMLRLFIEKRKKLLTFCKLLGIFFFSILDSEFLIFCETSLYLFINGPCSSWVSQLLTPNLLSRSTFCPGPWNPPQIWAQKQTFHFFYPLPM